MSTPGSESPLETWLLLIVRRGGEEILLSTDGAKYTLPRVHFPAQERISININRAVEREFGLRVISLYQVIPGGPAPPVDCLYHAVSAVPSAQMPTGDYRWISTRPLTPNLFSEERDFAAIEALRLGLEAARTDHAAEPFRNPGWFPEVKNWVDRSLRPYSLFLSGEFEQFTACPSFSLIRFETNRESVWFKAVGEPNLREWTLTLALARLCPDFIARTLAARRRWNAWLSLETPGESLATKAEPRCWEQAAASLASLQIRSVTDTGKLLEAGAHDLRVPRLLSLLDPFFEFATRATGRSPLERSKNLTPLEVSELKDSVRFSLQELEGLGRFETVGHMDLNPGNIFCTPDRAVFLDWAEGFVGNPLVSFEYLLQHFRRTALAAPILEVEFRNAYLKPWRNRISPKDLERALALSPLVALFAYAATVWSSPPADSPQQLLRERYLLGLVRKMKGEALQVGGERVEP